MSLSLNRTQQTKGVFVKSYGPKTPLWRYYIRSLLDFIGVKQPVEYYNKQKRLEFEEQTLALWQTYHLNAPNVIDRKNSELHLSVIEGKTLAEIFGVRIDLDIVSQLFDDLSHRHELAFKNDEPRLCHVDSNLRNIIYSNHHIFHVDFEMGREYEPVSRWAEREVSKLLVSVLQGLTSREREQVIELFFCHYKFRHVVNVLILGKSNKKKCRDGGQYSLCHLVLDLKRHKVNED